MTRHKIGRLLEKDAIMLPGNAHTHGHQTA